ncbi:MAG TPA: PilZ domain-containing protein [Candidatus Acidoferrum sp.]
MSTLTELEFLLVSNDYATLTAVSGGVKKYAAKLALVPTAEAARDYLERKKIDGVFVDMQVSETLGLIEAIRKGSSNSKVAIFAFVQNAVETTATLNAGANFVMRAPLTVEGVALHITIAKDIMLRERRRYFRHAVNLPVTLKDGEGEQRGRIINLSEGGMAVRAASGLKQWRVIEFALELGLGVDLSGKGQVAWTSSEGMAGILFQTLHGMGRGYLGAWLAAREQLSRKPEEDENPR